MWHEQTNECSITVIIVITNVITGQYLKRFYNKVGGCFLLQLIVGLHNVCLSRRSYSTPEQFHYARKSNFRGFETAVRSDALNSNPGIRHLRCLFPLENLICSNSSSSDSLLVHRHH